MPYPPTRAQVDAARIYLQDLFPAYKVFERLDDANRRFVFAIMKGKQRSGELQIARDFWEDKATAEQVDAALRQYKLSGGLRYFLSTKALSYDEARICPDTSCTGSLTNTTGKSPSCPLCGSREEQAP
ncbi:MAG: hypothetical protein MN733_39775 [Nitrososphaera sp.]|nr:hypothetical protein [Nitrososphaera sp.]